MQRIKIKDFIKKNLKNILATMFLIAGLIYDMYLYISPGKWFVDSDMASEMMLAKKLNDEGGILSKTWYYSTELRVFCQQWFLRIGIYVYPGNWHRARLIGGFLMILVAVLSAYFFFKMAGCSKEGAMFGAGIMAWPFGREYYFYAIWGLYYLSHIILAVILVLMFLWCLKNFDAKDRKLKVLLCLIASFLCGLNGIRLVYSTFIPLVLACLIVVFLDKKKESLNKWCISAAMMIFGILGWGYNGFVLVNNYHFNTFDNIAWKKEFSIKLEDLVRDYFCYYGYQSGAKLFSFLGIASCFGILLAVLVFACSIRLLFIYKKLDYVQQLLVMFYHSALFVHLMMFYFIDHYCSQYFLTLIPFAVLMVIIEFETENWNYRVTKDILAVIVVLCVLVSSRASALGEQTQPKYAIHSQYAQQQAVEYLLDNGYTQGFGSFWQTNVLTELSNGQIEMWNIGWRLNGKDNIDILEWLQSTDHAKTLPKGKTFIFYNRVDDWGFDQCPLLKNGKKVFENGYYSIFVYDSADEIVKGLK
ncbi:hypothetical protein [Butyrivibrio sp. NC3005]|uniref:hypothetical protein n=1 Tax=Butyrivibrio sp. NC3005 TaxID=1280685 RepID=UPI00040D4A5E|nr:hypothetical protein [Butyrivibrio sp. NC3005]